MHAQSEMSANMRHAPRCEPHAMPCEFTSYLFVKRCVIPSSKGCCQNGRIQCRDQGGVANLAGERFLASSRARAPLGARVAGYRLSGRRSAEMTFTAPGFSAESRLAD